MYSNTKCQHNHEVTLGNEQKTPGLSSKFMLFRNKPIVKHGLRISHPQIDSTPENSSPSWKDFHPLGNFIT